MKSAITKREVSKYFKEYCNLLASKNYLLYKTTQSSITRPHNDQKLVDTITTVLCHYPEKRLLRENKSLSIPLRRNNNKKRVTATRLTFIQFGLGMHDIKQNFAALLMSLDKINVLGTKSIVVIDQCDGDSPGGISTAALLRASSESTSFRLNELLEYVNDVNVQNSAFGNLVLETITIDNVLDSPESIKLYCQNFQKLISALNDGKIPILIPSILSSTARSQKGVIINDIILTLCKTFLAKLVPDSMSTSYLTDITRIYSEIYVDLIVLVAYSSYFATLRANGNTPDYLHLLNEYHFSMSELEEQLFRGYHDFPRVLKRTSTLIDGKWLRQSHNPRIRIQIRNIRAAERLLKTLSSSALIHIRTGKLKTKSEKYDVSNFSQQSFEDYSLVRSSISEKPVTSTVKESCKKKKWNRVEIKKIKYIRKGEKLHLFPFPTDHVWSFNLDRTFNSKTLYTIINKRKLMSTIEESFSKNINRPQYDDRLSGNIAGVIIASTYKGCVIVTKEKQSTELHENKIFGTLESDSITYLDKFAVAKSKQAVVDTSSQLFRSIEIVYGDGYLWRSSISNKINPWYFQRSVGSWNIPHTRWKIFWNLKAIEVNKTLWGNTIEFCSKNPSTFNP